MWTRDKGSLSREGRLIEGPPLAVEIRVVGEKDSTAVKVTDDNRDELMRRFPTFFAKPKAKRARKSRAKK